MGIANLSDVLMNVVNGFSRGELSAYSLLETGHKNYLLYNDGSAATIIRYNGTVSLGGRADLDEMTTSASVALASFFSKPGHAMQVFYYRDPERAEGMLTNASLPARNTAKSLGLTLDDLFDEEVKHLNKFVSLEDVYFVLWTRPSVVPKVERKLLDKSRSAPSWWPRASDTQNLSTVAEGILSRHRAFVNTFATEFQNLRMSIQVIDVHEAVRKIRDSVYVGSDHEAWRAFMPGMVGKNRKGQPRPPARRLPAPTFGGADDYGYLLWPSLNSQIFDQPATKIGNKVEIADKLYAPMDLMFGQQNETWFNALINRVRDLDEMPWRCSFLIEGDGMAGTGMNRFLASIIGWANKTHNHLYDSTMNALARYNEGDGCVVRLRMSFCTWGPKTDPELVEMRAQKLQRAIESWGYTQVSAATGDAVDAFMSSALALQVASTARAGTPPLDDAFYILPLMREASPFDEGDMLLRTRDGRLWPAQIASPQHNLFNSLIYGPSGSGKSVFMNTRNLAYCLSPRAANVGGEFRLPLLGIIEIGKSSEGTISVIKDAAPAHMRHEAIFHRLRMIERDAINPMDTQLGLRTPLVMERAFAINLIATLLTPVGAATVPENVTELTGQVVDILYDRFSDLSGNRARPRFYTPNEAPEVDDAIQKFGLTLGKNQTWWGITDMLFDRGAKHEALLAQRYASPRIEDLTTVLNDEKLKIWQNAKMPGTMEPLLAFFERMINSAMSEYPIFRQPTKLDFGSARIISIDLSEVAKSGSAASNKMAAISYMLARFLIMRTYQLHPDDMIDVPNRYDEYYKDLVPKIVAQPKRIVFDEFHRTAAAPSVREQTVIDMREGRKYNTQIDLASQILTDFDPAMIKNSSEFWILGRADRNDADRARETFNLSPEATNVIWNTLKGPTAEGGPMLVVMNLKSNTHEHLLYNTLSPQKAWALSTTREDITLRDILYRKLGQVEARRRLGIRFPGGSANTEIQRRIFEAAKTSTRMDEEAMDGVIAELAQEITGERL